MPPTAIVQSVPTIYIILRVVTVGVIHSIDTRSTFFCSIIIIIIITIITIFPFVNGILFFFQVEDDGKSKYCITHTYWRLKPYL